LEAAGTGQRVIQMQSRDLVALADAPFTISSFSIRLGPIMMGARCVPCAHSGYARTDGVPPSFLFAQMGAASCGKISTGVI